VNLPGVTGLIGRLTQNTVARARVPSAAVETCSCTSALHLCRSAQCTLMSLDMPWLVLRLDCFSNACFELFCHVALGRMAHCRSSTCARLSSVLSATCLPPPRHRHGIRAAARAPIVAPPSLPSPLPRVKMISLSKAVIHTQCLLQELPDCHMLTLQEVGGLLQHECKTSALMWL
jgi:hypothetical protein